jgi:hypothetical protein
MTTIAYASAHIDGVLDCRSLKVGILETPQPTPVAFFQVIAGVQRHPVWAIDRMAAFVYCYCHAADDHDQAAIEINLTGNLVSGDRTACVVVSNIFWHTSKRIRSLAETMIASMISNGNGHSWANHWPSHEAMQMPVNEP